MCTAPKLRLATFEKSFCCEETSSDCDKQEQKPDYNGTVFDALSDVFHGSLLAKLPTHSLIIFSMVSMRAKELVDTAPKVLDLWYPILFSPRQHYVCARVSEDDIQYGACCPF
jgi:hypothetical protein